MATVRDVAKRAQVSIGTVSRYLNGEKLKSSTQERVEEAIVFLEYRQNYIAKGLKNNRSLAIGVLINSLKDVFATSVVSSLETYVEKFGYSIILSDYQSDPKRLAEKVEFLLKRSIDGLVVFHGENHSVTLKKAVQDSIPIVAIDSPIEEIKADTVLIDNYDASYQATQRLIDKGLKKIGIIAGQKENFIGRERLRGYKKALETNKITLNNQLIWNGDYSVQSGYEGVNKLLNENSNLDAIFTINYYMTLGAIKALRQHNMKIGEDIGLIAFDRFEYNDVLTPAITSITQPVEQMGEVAGELLIERITGRSLCAKNKTVICNTQLFVGESDEKRLHN